MMHPGIFSRLGLGLVAASLLVGLSGCNKRWVRPSSKTPSYQETKDNIIVRVAQLNKADCKRRFGKNLLSYGYQPLLLNIYNNSDDALLIRASSIDLPLESAYEVANIVRLPVFAFTAAPAYAAALFFWPAIIPVIGAGMWMGAHNRSVAQKLQQIALEGDQAIEILPYERMQRVLFVSAAAPDTFCLHLFNMHQKTFIPFTITIQ